MALWASPNICLDSLPLTGVCFIKAMDQRQTLSGTVHSCPSHWIFLKALINLTTFIPGDWLVHTDVLGLLFSMLSICIAVF